MLYNWIVLDMGELFSTLFSTSGENKKLYLFVALCHVCTIAHSIWRAKYFENQPKVIKVLLNDM